VIIIIIAHKSKTDKKEQAWREHSRNVAKLCRLEGEKLRLGKLAELIGLLHDHGKGSLAWQRFIKGIGVQHPTHAGLGAWYVWQSWWKSEKSVNRRRTAQLISLCIYGHHAGLPDCLDISGGSPFLEGLQNQPEEACKEATENFYEEVASQDELDRLFEEACRELDEFGLEKVSFEWGLLVRLLLSILVDADRWDSACFEYDADPFAGLPGQIPDWEMLLERLEAYVERFPKEGELAKIRRDISAQCREAGKDGPGIYTLSVPTGGGKTLASLRYGLTQAKRNGQRRIFYLIPMNTILDQNAEDIREALAEHPSILEHHSNIVLEEDAEKGQSTKGWNPEQEKYRRLTERWADSDIILTSLVNFLEALFRKENSKVRRMQRLTNSVLIFDEIQALPKKCRELFKRALRFLVKYCNCTVLLCTATQPDFGLESKELIADVDVLYRKLKRVTYVSELEERTYQETAVQIASFSREKKSVLTVVNTKYAAWCVFREVSERLEMSGYRMVEIRQGLTDKELECCAEACQGDEVLCVHLSTLMCPGHRKEILRWVKAWLKKMKMVYCSSTALIEAGINVSFPIVVRSLTGIPSLIQAAGRCNRNCEADRGTVYLWNLSEERLSLLPDIQKGKEISMNLLQNIGRAEDIGSPEIIQKYFRKEEVYTRQVEQYPYKNWNSDLVEMFSVNAVCQNAAKDRRENPLPGLSKRLRQSFRTAGSAFQVIDQKTKGVLVPYGKGRLLIEELAGSHSLCEEIQYLKDAQQYSVNLYEQIFELLAAEGALYSLGETGVVVLREEYYDAWAGVRTTAEELKTLIV